MIYIVEISGRDGLSTIEEEAYTAADAVTQVNLRLDKGFPRNSIYSVKPKAQAGGATVSESERVGIHDAMGTTPLVSVGLGSQAHPVASAPQPAAGDGLGPNDPGTHVTLETADYALLHADAMTERARQKARELEATGDGTGEDGRGLYRKYDVRRLNDPASKHTECEYYVLDLDHDRFSLPALLAYARSCNKQYPELARDIGKKCVAMGRRFISECPSHLPELKWEPSASASASASLREGEVYVLETEDISEAEAEGRPCWFPTSEREGHGDGEVDAVHGARITPPSPSAGYRFRVVRYCRAENADEWHELYAHEADRVTELKEKLSAAASERDEFRDSAEGEHALNERLIREGEAMKEKLAAAEQRMRTMEEQGATVADQYERLERKQRETAEKLAAAEAQLAMRGDSEVQRRLNELSCGTLDAVAPELLSLRGRLHDAEERAEKAEARVREMLEKAEPVKS